MNRRFQRGGLPDANTLYMLYQTLVGAWPIDADRLGRFLMKAARKAKRQSSWVDPAAAYEEALTQYAANVLACGEFVRDFEAFLAPLIEPARITGLAHTLLRMTAPGVPDIYQGGELWNLSLVDPDNRRPVDYELRRRLLKETETLERTRLLERMDEGRPKLLVIHRTLAVRRRLPACFQPGAEHQPIWPRGEKAEHLVAYRRGERVVVAVPRLVLSLGDEWGDTRLDLPEGRWRDAFTGAEFSGGATPAGPLFFGFPVALLTREEKADG
jgi:(1->4)-alpha-D-glucan 1-alpha-D-glucosylmutase